MEITEIQISIYDHSRLKGFADIIFDNLFIIRGLKIIKGRDKYFVAMPSRKDKNGIIKDIAHPLNSFFREKIEKIVLDKYWKMLKRYKI